MKKVLIIAIIILLLLPIIQSEKSGTSTESFPSKKDITEFLYSLQVRVHEMTFFKKSNIIEKIILKTGNIDYAIDDANPLKDALIAFYIAEKVDYTESAVNDFINKLNFTAEVSNAVSLILFSYSGLLNAKTRGQQIDNTLSVFEGVREASTILMGHHMEKYFEDNYKKIMFGSSGNDTYECCHTFMIDFGGHDRYAERNNSFILDLNGNDTYRKQLSFSGSVLVFDLAGNDEYYDFPFSSNGISLLYDWKGSDTYFGTVVSSYETGISALIDVEGNDIYVGKNHTQCYAHEGTSVLIDIQGNDIYNASSRSQACTEGGIALLIDIYGNDAFFGGDYSQAYAKWLVRRGIAILMNMQGNDVYNAEDFSQGFGESGFAVLFDFFGEDVYKAYQFSQAVTSSLFGLAALFDAEGSNRFTSSLFSQGHTMILGVGTAFFMDNFNFEESYELFMEVIDNLNIDIQDILPYLLSS